MTAQELRRRGRVREDARVPPQRTQVDDDPANASA